MTIFDDYVSWKYENHDLIKALVSHHSKTISRFTPVIAVVDYLSEQHENGRRLSEDEEVFFSTGFDYIYDQFEFIKLQLDNNFDKNVKELEKCAETINLAIYINDFQAEVLENPGIQKTHIDSLLALKEEVDNYLSKKQNAPEEYFGILNDIGYKLFEQNGIEIHTIDQIYFEIAIELGIYQDDDEFSVYNEILNKQILKTRKNA